MHSIFVTDEDTGELSKRVKLDRLDLAELNRIVCRIVRRLVVSQDCEDVAQEAVSSLWSYSEAQKIRVGNGMSEGEAIRALLTTIAIRAAKAHRRKTKPDKLIFQSDLSGFSCPCPAAAYEARDAIRKVEALSPKLRAVVKLDALGHTATEVARLLGVTSNTARSRLFLARDVLATLT